MVLQCYGAIVLQFYGATVEMFLCQDAVMLCCVSDSMSITYRQTDRATTRGPSGPKNQFSNPFFINAKGLLHSSACFKRVNHQFGQLGRIAHLDN